MKRTTYFPILATLVVLVSVSAFNEAYAITYTAIQDGDWSDPTTWGQPTPPSSADFVIIPLDRTVTISVEIIDNNGGIINNGVLINEGTLNSIGIENAGTINNEGQITIVSNGFMENRGTINNIGTITLDMFTEFDNILGTIINSGTLNDSSSLFENDSGAIINNVGAVFTTVGTEFNMNSLSTIQNSGILSLNSATLNLSGAIANNVGGIINIGSGNLRNIGTITNFGNIAITGIIHNFNTITNQAGGTVENDGQILNRNKINNSGLFTNDVSGVITQAIGIPNFGIIYNNLGGIFNNSGHIDNQVPPSTIDNSGTFNNHATINSLGNIYNRNDGVFTNSGMLDNPGLIENYGQLDNNGAINNSGTIGKIDNRGTINNQGIIDNSRTFNNIVLLNNFGTINNLDTFNNPGIFNNECGGVFNDSGTFSGNPINPIPCPPVIVTLEPSQDSFIRKGAKNTNEGANTILMVQKAGNKRTLISFDLSDQQGPVSSAMLKLYVTYNGGNWGKQNDRMVEIHKLLSDWIEGNGANFIPKNLDEDDEPIKNKGTGFGVTWACSTDSNISNKKSDCDPKWNGGNFDGAITDYEIITSTTSGWIEFDVTDDVNLFLSGNSDNFGWLIKKSNEGNSGRIAFASSENANLDNRPQLVLESSSALPE